MKSIVPFCLICLISFFSVSGQEYKDTTIVLQFQEDHDIIPLEKRSRRKFDNAVIGDLDQDGYLDLLLTEHSRRVELYWNNKGKFEKGESFIFGDTHGISIGDYNKDGQIDIIVQPGGGGGKNLRSPRIYHVNKDRNIEEGRILSHFENTRGRAVKLLDFNLDGQLDLLTSAFPQIDSLSHANFIYKSDQDNEFEFVDYLPYADRFGMRTLVTDFNSDNIPDFLFYGGQEIIAVQGKENFGFKNVTKDVLGSNSNTTNVTSISEIDYDNDGDFDLFLTRARWPFGTESEYSKKNKTLYFFDRNRSFLYDSLKVEGNLKVENLQMAYPDFDIFIGSGKKLWERSSDRHGHQDLNLSPDESRGWPKDTTSNGLYIGYLGNGYWRVGGHTKSPTSAVLHNVMSEPETNEPKPIPTKLLENVNGKFADATENLNLKIEQQTSSSAVGDVNNDGWLDLFILRYGNPSTPTKQLLYLNHKGKKFIQSKNHGIITKELGATGMGADFFDYDKDGDLDIIYSNERGRWHLFNNKSELKNNYLEVNIKNSPSGKATAIGATLTINACGKTYQRVVGATSSPYSQSYTTLLHVGLGKCNKIDKAEVTWTNGEKVQLETKILLNEVNSAGIQ